MIIADTSVWIPFFNRPASAEKRELDRLIDADEVAMVGIVFAELLQGCRSPRDREEIKDALSSLPHFETTRAVWIRVDDLSASLLRRGITLPLSDLVVAVVALENRCRVYSLDQHFKKIPDLGLHVAPTT